MSRKEIAIILAFLASLNIPGASAVPTVILLFMGCKFLLEKAYEANK